MSATTADVHAAAPALGGALGGVLGGAVASGASGASGGVMTTNFWETERFQLVSFTKDMVNQAAAAMMGVFTKRMDEHAVQVATGFTEVRSDLNEVKTEMVHQGSVLRSELSAQGAVLETVGDQVTALQSVMVTKTDMVEAVSVSVSAKMDTMEAVVSDKIDLMEAAVVDKVSVAVSLKLGSIEAELASLKQNQPLTAGLESVLVRYILFAIRDWGMNTHTGELCALFTKTDGKIYLVVHTTLLLEIISRRDANGKRAHGLTINTVKGSLLRLNSWTVDSDEAARMFNLFSVDHYNSAAADAGTLFYLVAARVRAFFVEMEMRHLSNPCARNTDLPEYRLLMRRGGKATGKSKSKINETAIQTAQNMAMYAPFATEFSAEFLSSNFYNEAYEIAAVTHHFNGFEIMDVPVRSAAEIYEEVPQDYEFEDGEGAGEYPGEAEMEEDDNVAVSLGLKSKRKRKAAENAQKPRAKRVKKVKPATAQTEDILPPAAAAGYETEEVLAEGGIEDENEIDGAIVLSSPLPSESSGSVSSPLSVDSD